jgi:hypothetical protein
MTSTKTPPIGMDGAKFGVRRRENGTSNQYQRFSAFCIKPP